MKKPSQTRPCITKRAKFCGNLTATAQRCHSWCWPGWVTAGMEMSGGSCGRVPPDLGKPPFRQLRKYDICSANSSSSSSLSPRPHPPLKLAWLVVGYNNGRHLHVRGIPTSAQNFQLSRSPATAGWELPQNDHCPESERGGEREKEQGFGQSLIVLPTHHPSALVAPFFIATATLTNPRLDMAEGRVHACDRISKSIHWVRGN